MNVKALCEAKFQVCVFTHIYLQLNVLIHAYSLHRSEKMKTLGNLALSRYLRKERRDNVEAW